MLYKESQEVFLETRAVMQTVVPHHLSDSECITTPCQPLSISQGGGRIVNYQLLFQ